MVWPSSRTRLQVKSLIPAQSSKDFGKGQYICNFIPFFTSYKQFMYNIRNMGNLRVNLWVQARPRMGENLLLSEKLTKLALADDLGFCFVMLYPFHSTCTFSRPGIEPGNVRLNSPPRLPFSHNTPPNSVKGRGSKLVPINGTQAYTITRIYTAYAATHE